MMLRVSILLAVPVDTTRHGIQVGPSYVEEYVLLLFWFADKGERGEAESMPRINLIMAS